MSILARKSELHQLVNTTALEKVLAFVDVCTTVFQLKIALVITASSLASL